MLCDKSPLQDTPKGEGGGGRSYLWMSKSNVIAKWMVNAHIQKGKS